MTANSRECLSPALKGQVIVVSGAARGMGAAQAREFARQGARVVLIDLLAEELEAEAAEIRSAGCEAIAIIGNVASGEDWKRCIDAAIARFGRIDGLVNNAGIHRSTPFEEIEADEWDLVQAINLKGVFLGTKAVLPAMKAAGRGAIVNISSVAAIGGIGKAHYSASKAGVLSLTRVTAVHQGPYGIRANAILPGVVETEMTGPALSIAESRERLLRATPLGVILSADDIAAAATFLLSDAARFVSGAQLVVDGAFSIAGQVG